MSWIQTYSGGRFDPLEPDLSAVTMTDIAHALSNTCRFAGHSRHFYSVAQHCVHVSQLVPREFAFEALMHDAHEALLSDLPAPYKFFLPEFKAFEERLRLLVADHYDLPGDVSPEVKHADLVALATERRDLMFPTDECWPVLKGIVPDKQLICPMYPAAARSVFLTRFECLMRGRGSDVDRCNGESA